MNQRSASNTADSIEWKEKFTLLFQFVVLPRQFLAVFVFILVSLFRLRPLFECQAFCVNSPEIRQSGCRSSRQVTDAAL